MRVAANEFSYLDPWLTGTIILVVIASYALGCITCAYYFVRWWTGQDIRTLGSGNAGAKNVGRVIGKWGFVVTFLGDFAKGMGAVSLAKAFNLPDWAVTLAMLAVVAGHNWPIQLGFQGGKGISTSLGAVLVYSPLATVCLVGCFLILFAAWRKFTLSGLMAYAAAPIILWFFHLAPVMLIGMFLLAVEVIFAHRQNLCDEFLRLKTVGSSKPGDAL